MYSFKNKVAISLLTLLIFIGQVTASVIPCQMDMQNQTNSTESFSMQSQMDHSNMDHSIHIMNDSQDSVDTTDSMNMDCCNNQNDCSMGGCFSMLTTFNLLSVSNPVTSRESFQASSFTVKKIPSSLYRPPISN